MKAALCARVSSKEQEKEGYSIPAQLKLLKDYACKNGIKIVKFVGRVARYLASYLAIA